jgi:hypothetical protein
MGRWRCSDCGSARHRLGGIVGGPRRPDWLCVSASLRMRGYYDGHGGRVFRFSGLQQRGQSSIMMVLTNSHCGTDDADRARPAFALGLATAAPRWAAMGPLAKLRCGRFWRVLPRPPHRPRTANRSWAALPARRSANVARFRHCVRSLAGCVHTPEMPNILTRRDTAPPVASQ